MPQVSTGAVEFRHVSFGYSPEHQLMHDVNITVKSGQKVAIVGPTGAGKTTLINLLMRFYDVDGGSILVDGVDTKEMTRHELRDRFGMVLQDAWLFEGSIRDNIAYAQDNLPEEKSSPPHDPPAWTASSRPCQAVMILNFPQGRKISHKVNANC